MTTNRANMINAFRSYYSKDKSVTINAKEHKAVENCLFMFKRVKNGKEIQNAVEAVYIKSNKRRGDISNKVHRHAAETYTATHTIYNYLKKAEEIYTKEIEILTGAEYDAV